MRNQTIYAILVEHNTRFSENPRESLKYSEKQCREERLISTKVHLNVIFSEYRAKIGINSEKYERIEATVSTRESHKR